MKLKYVQNWSKYDQNQPKNDKNQANWPRNIQKVRKLLQKSYSWQTARELPSKSYYWPPNLVGTMCLGAATICSSDEGVKYPCEKFNYQGASKGNLAQNKRTVHEGVKFPCGQCNYQVTLKWTLAEHKRVVHEWVKYPCETIKQHQRGILLNIKGQCMKEANILPSNAAIKQHQKEVFLNTKEWHMKELDSHTGVTISIIL